MKHNSSWIAQTSTLPTMYCKSLFASLYIPCFQYYCGWLLQFICGFGYAMGCHELFRSFHIVNSPSSVLLQNSNPPLRSKILGTTGVLKCLADDLCIKEVSCHFILCTSKINLPLCIHYWTKWLVCCHPCLWFQHVLLMLLLTLLTSFTQV